MSGRKLIKDDSAVAPAAWAYAGLISTERLLGSVMKRALHKRRAPKIRQV
jgi:hypothetical protein